MDITTTAQCKQGGASKCLRTATRNLKQIAREAHLLHTAAALLKPHMWLRPISANPTSPGALAATTHQSELHNKHEIIQTRNKEAINMTGFLDLPAELRNRVYETIVTRNQVIPISKTVGQSSQYPVLQDHELIFPGLPALSGVNRQVRAEALAIFYGTNTFNSHSMLDTQVFLHRLDSRSLTMLRDIRASTYQINNIQQILKPCLQKLVNHHASGFLSSTAAKVPLRTKRTGRGGSNQDFEVTWVSLPELDLWERDPRDIDMVRRVTNLSGY